MTRLLTAVLFFTLVSAPLDAAKPLPVKGRQMLWVTNAYGNDVHVIDVATHKVVKRVEVGPQPHGIAAPDDASVVYLAIENFKGPVGELLWVNPRTYKVEHRLPLGPKPNQLACTPDGRWIYVPCNDGKYWVIDGKKRRVVKKITTGGRPHNTKASRNGRRMYLSPMGSPRRVTIVDVLAGHKVVGEIPYSNVVRPPALAPDESRHFQNLDGLIGFEVADIKTRKVIARIHHEVPKDLQAKASRCHGLAVRPDMKEIWSCDVTHELVHIHDITSDAYPQVARLKMIGHVYWLCFSPDSRYAYISVRAKNKVCVVDTKTKQIIKHITVGDTPKRNLVIVLADKPAAGGQ